MLPLLILGGIGLFAYSEVQKAKAMNAPGSGAIARPSKAVTTQPSQKYPFQNPAMLQPRQDTNPNSFPFFGGGTQFISAANKAGVNMPGGSSTSAITDDANLVSAVSGAWNEMGISDMFSSSDDSGDDTVDDSEVEDDSDFSDY